MIENSYKLSLLDIPSPACFNNNFSAKKNKLFVKEAVLELLYSDRVIEGDTIPHVVNPLSVSVKSSGNKHLILILRYVNQYLLWQAHK